MKFLRPVWFNKTSIPPYVSREQIVNDIESSFLYTIYLHKYHQAFIFNNTVRSVDLVCGLKGVDPNNLLI